MKNNKFKRFLSCIGVFILAGAVVAGSSFSAYASRVSDYANSPDNLATIQRYNKAMETCIPGGLGGSFSYDYSGSGKYQVENIQKSYDHLMGGQYFFSSLSGNLIYSEEFEKNISQGSYDGGVFGSGNDDGKMYCGENNSALLGNALSVFGLQKDAATLKSLYCDDNKDGIFTITKKKYDSNYKVAEEDSNCSKNFDLFVQYAQNKTTDPVYSISVSPSSNAGNYYKQWFKNKVGDLSSITSDQKKALAYADAAHNFVTLCSVSGPSDNSFNSKSEVKIYDAFSGKASSSTKEVHYQIGVDADDKFYTGINGKTEQTCAEMAASLTKDGAAAYAKVMGIAADNPGENPTAPIDPNAGTTGNSSKNQCYDGAGSLGWIACPVIEMVTNALDGIYEDMVEPFLRIETKFLDDSSETYKGWSIFRTIANTAFAILLLVIIFSQVTGVGIDNYGIKKTLPKLIIAAVLINLSYIICQLAVDLSNILGSSLNSMLSGLASQVSTPVSTNFTSGAWFKHLLNTTVDVAGIGGGTAIVLSVMNTGFLSAILLPLLMGLIIALFAIIFFFVLLGVRKAGVVILVVLSPLAFVCYMLPNTKKLFDKWLKMFEGLLLLYPICGLLIGGSTLASAIIVGGTDDFFMYLIGLLLMAVPFFFVPTLLKGSFAAMGNLGAKISGMGSKMGRGLAGRTNKGIRGTESFKNYQAEKARATQIRNANRISSRLKAKEARNGHLSSADNLRLARAEMMKSKFSGEDLDAQMVNMKASTKNFDNDTMASQLGALLQGKKIEKGSVEELQAKALMKKLSKNGGYGQKLLAKQMGAANADNRQFAAEFMSKDGDVSAAVAKKDSSTAQYLRDINAGMSMSHNGSDVAAASLSRSEWLESTNTARNGGLSNAQFVMDKVLTDDSDFASQSAGNVASMLGVKEIDGQPGKFEIDENGTNLMSKDRLERVVSNERLMQSIDGDVAEAIKTRATAMGIAIPSSSSVEAEGGFPTEFTIKNSKDGSEYTISLGHTADSASNSAQQNNQSNASGQQQNGQNPGTGTPNQA